MSLYYVNVYIHVLAAVFWLGGMFFLAAVGAPVLRRVEPPPLRQQLFRQLGTQFRTAGWVAIAVLVVTGLLNLHLRGFLTSERLGSGAFWATPYGRTLALKLAAVGAMLVLQAVHDFVAGPRASRQHPGSAGAIRTRRSAAMLARIGAVLGLVVLYAAVRLARGG